MRPVMKNAMPPTRPAAMILLSSSVSMCAAFLGGRRGGYRKPAEPPTRAVASVPRKPRPHVATAPAPAQARAGAPSGPGCRRLHLRRAGQFGEAGDRARAEQRLVDPLVAG